MKSKYLFTIIVSLVLMALMEGCEIPPTEPTPTPTPTSVPPPPPGTLPIGLLMDCFQCSSNLFGFTQIFTDNGTVIVYKWGEVELTGKWKLEGDILITGDSWCGDMLTMPATYKWHFDGEYLTFQMIDDYCPDRIDSWDGTSWGLIKPLPTGTFSAKSGERTLELRDDNSFTFSRKDTFNTFGTFSFEGNIITWETDQFCDQDDAGKATYSWIFDNNILMFRLVGRDKCLDRMAFLKAPFKLNDDN